MDDSFELGGLDESFTEVTVTTLLTCDICNYTTKKKFNLDRHMKVHGDKASSDDNDEPESYPHLCGQCGKRYKSLVGLTHHVKRVHQQAFTYCCAICNKGYNGLANYRGHLASHDQALCEKCPKCKKTFRYRKSFLIHRQRCGRPAMPKVQCTDCEKEFVSKEGMRQHARVVHENLKYRCHKCIKTFKWRSGLAYHMKRCRAMVN